MLWGYNDTSIRPVIGPGYYVVHDTPGITARRVGLRLHPAADLPSAGWPEIRSNERGLSRFIYNGTVDYMRRVSPTCSSARRPATASELGNYFVLVREIGA